MPEGGFEKPPPPSLNRVKYTFLAVKIISVAIDFCGKIGGHNFTRTKAKTLFVDTICDITLTEYENRFVPFNLAVLFLAWNSI